MGSGFHFPFKYLLKLANVAEMSPFIMIRRFWPLEA